MQSKKLKIGRIPYANLFPIFHYLDERCNGTPYRFVEGVPSKLNRMLREGELDISPSSSIEYLRNKDRYRILPWFSISSTGPIKSILLFSNTTIEELDGQTIAVTAESESSVALLKVVVEKFHSLKCRFSKVNKRSVNNILKDYPAVMLIGDTAMIEAQKVTKSYESGIKSRNTVSGLRTPDSRLNIYDLGELWDKHTGLPFVYALGAVRRGVTSEKKDLIEKLSRDLLEANKYAVSGFPRIAGAAPQTKWLGEKELVSYWNLISYDFTDRHLEGLRLFEKLALNKRCKSRQK
jgi:chorismate dehydratase